MAGNILNKYGTVNQSITLTFGITNATFRSSTVVDNTSNLFVDALVQITVLSAAASTSATGYIDIYAYGTSGGSPTYSGGVSGTDATYSGQLSALVKLGRLAVIANGTQYTSSPISIAAAFGGSLPSAWGIVIDNESGATPQSGSAWYQGAEGQYT